MKIIVSQEFVDQCIARSNIYNAGERSEQQLIRDIECEIFEYHMISTDQWDDHDSWKVDGVSDVYGNVDVKFIDKFYVVGVQDLKIIENVEIQESEEFEIDEEENTLSILNRYIDESEFELDKNVIKSIFQDLYKQACEVE